VAEDGIGGVYAPTRLPAARLNVRVPDGLSDLGAALADIGELGQKFEEDRWEVQAAALETELQAKVSDLEILSTNGENAARAHDLFTNGMNEIMGTDMSALPSEYQEAIRLGLRTMQVDSQARVLRRQNEWLESSKAATDDAGFVQAESSARKVGSTSGIGWRDKDGQVASIVGPYVSRRAALRGSMKPEDFVNQTRERKEEVWLSAIEEHGTTDSVGALEWLDSKLASNELPATDKTAALRAKLTGTAIEHRGATIGQLVFDKYPESAESRERAILALSKDSKVISAARSAADRLASARANDLEHVREKAERDVTARLNNLAEIRTTAHEEGALDPLFETTGDGRVTYSPHFESERKLAKSEWLVAGLPSSEFEELWQKRIVEGSDIRSSGDALEQLRSLTPSDLANLDLERFRGRLSTTDYQTWLDKQHVAKNQWNVESMDKRIKAASLGMSAGDAKNFNGQIWSALAVASRDLEGKGHVTEEDFARILADTKTAAVTGGGWDDSLVDEDPASALELIEDEGTAVQRETLRAVREKLRRNNKYPVPDEYVLGAWRIAMSGVGREFKAVGDEVRNRLDVERNRVHDRINAERNSVMGEFR